uniref:Uncharacterized protein n=1 Tax=Plectus sambesii TaxID=2011161 RepID=A0A914VYD4_9BILA
MTTAAPGGGASRRRSIAPLDAYIIIAGRHPAAVPEAAARRRFGLLKRQRSGSLVFCPLRERAHLCTYVSILRGRQRCAYSELNSGLAGRRRPGNLRSLVLQ